MLVIPNKTRQIKPHAPNQTPSPNYTFQTKLHHLTIFSKPKYVDVIALSRTSKLYPSPPGACSEIMVGVEHVILGGWAKIYIYTYLLIYKRIINVLIKEGNWKCCLFSPLLSFFIFYFIFFRFLSLFKNSWGHYHISDMIPVALPPRAFKIPVLTLFSTIHNVYYLTSINTVMYLVRGSVIDRSFCNIH